MDKILSQEEVDSLLEGIEKGEVSTEEKKEEKREDIIVYDFRGEDTPSEVKLPGIIRINERFIMTLRSSLLNILRKDIDITLEKIRSMNFSDFSKYIPLPSSLNIFKINPLGGSGLLVLEGNLTFIFIDIFFGGRGISHVKLEGRSFTPIEMKVIKKISKVMLENYESAWSEIYNVHLEYTGSEMDPQFVSIASPKERIIVSEFTIYVEGTNGNLFICFPHSILDPIMDKLKMRKAEAPTDNNCRKVLEEILKDIELDLVCILGNNTLSANELINLKIGDTIPINTKVKFPLIITVEGIPKFKGFPGSLNGRKAIKIAELL